MDTPQTNDTRGHIGVGFVDVLFAIVMGISATKVLELDWFKQEPGFMWQSSFFFEMGVLLLGYSTLIASWVGYHRSYGTDPQQIRTFPEWATFIIDIFLLACYLIILTKFQSFIVVLSVLFLVFGFYVAWDIFRQRQRMSSNEEMRQRKERRQRMGVSRFWAICFGFLLVSYLCLDLINVTLVVADWLPVLARANVILAGDWVFLLLAFTGVILYRFHKEYLWLSIILDIIMGHWPKRKVNG